MAGPGLTRRTALKTASLAATALAAPFVRGAYAAGRLAVAAWDHRMPGAGKALGQICGDWAAKEKVELTFDLITSRDGKDVLTLEAEAQAKVGHDLIGVRLWDVAAQKDNFVPVDEIVDPLVAENGAIASACEYLGKIDGHWRAVPTSYGSFAAPVCARIDYLRDLAGLDVQKMYPGPGGAPDQGLVDAWTWDNLLAAADRCNKAGHFFATGLSRCNDAIDMTGAVFAAFGAQLVDKDGHPTVGTDQTRQALEWFRKLAKSVPDTVFAYDDASNDKALLSGQSALIFNAPDAHAAAVRSAPAVAAQLWTFPAPKGPQGRYDPAEYYYWGIWNFSPNIAAAKSLVAYLSTRDIQEKLVTASAGYDLPPFQNLTDFAVWQQQGPPPGTLYNYPPRGDVVATVAGQSAPLKIAAQLYERATLPRMIALCTRNGKSVDDAIKWAEAEIAGFTRG